MEILYFCLYWSKYVNKYHASILLMGYIESCWTGALLYPSVVGLLRQNQGEEMGQSWAGRKIPRGGE